MRVVKVTLPEDHEIVIASCSHEGALGQDKDGFQEMIESVRTTKDRYLIHLGDYAEAFTVDDKRYDQRHVKESAFQQYVAVRNDLESIALKILCLLEGNHDATLARRFGDMVKDYLCAELGVSYGTYTTVLQVMTPGNVVMYKMFLTHGSGRITSNADDPLRRRANLKLSIKRKLALKMSDCEIMAMGHTHRLLTVPPTEWLKLYTDDKVIRSVHSAPRHEQFIHPDNRWYVNAGSFYKLYVDGASGYAERFGYDPLDLGYAIVECRNGQVNNVREVLI